MPVSLFDAFTRHQIYLEGYKDNLDTSLDPVMRRLYTRLSTALNDTQVSKLNELSKRQLQRLISTIRDIVAESNDAYLTQILRELERYSQAESDMQRGILEAVTGQTVEAAYAAAIGAPLIGIAALANTRTGYDRLWASVSNTVDPATGLTPLALLKNFLGSTSRSITQLVARGHANGWTLTEMLRELFGTRSRLFRDGLARRIVSNGSSVLRTIVQHVSSRVQAAIASVFYSTYEWVAVLDTRTSDICRFRDGTHYTYGAGPLPPAHYRCRSRAVPVSKGRASNAYADTFYTWIQRQPVAVQNDILGVRRARDLRAGRANAASMLRFRSRQQLTRTQLAGKFKMITAT